MAKKAKKVSWRTLTRQAGKERSPRKASALRKQAWAARRADRAAKRKKVKKAAPAARRDLPGAVRAAKGWATRRANEVTRAASDSAEMQQIRNEIRNAGASQGTQFLRARVVEQDGVQVATNRGLPGQGELVGGVFSQLADRVVKLARKKGGTDAIQNELAALAASSKYEGSVETDKTATKRLIEVQKIMADRIVCGFLTEIEHTMNFHRGLPPGMVHVIDSFTITKIVDALNNAGYTSQGSRQDRYGTDTAKSIDR